MILLPKGNPVKENVDPGRVNLPDALGKLRAGVFTGYLRFDTGGGTGIVIFEKGRLISALFEGEKDRLIAYDAIARVFQESLTTPSKLNIYRFSPDLAMSIHTLLHGDILYKGQELKLLDIKALLGRLKEDRMNGCLRIYTKERIALIFYRDGNAVGFFHDGSTDIETTADTSMSVARLPGAKVDVLTTNSPEELMLADLMESADIASLWERAKKAVTDRQRKQTEESGSTQEAQVQDRREKLLAFLKTTAEKHIGKIGGSLVEKEFARSLAAGTVTEGALNSFYDSLTKAAKLVAGPSAVSTMQAEMQRGVKTLIK